MTDPDERLRQMNQEIRNVVAARGDRTPEDLVPDVSAVMRRYGVPEPDREGMLTWIDNTVAEVDAVR